MSPFRQKVAALRPWPWKKAASPQASTRDLGAVNRQAFVANSEALRDDGNDPPSASVLAREDVPDESRMQDVGDPTLICVLETSICRAAANVAEPTAHDRLNRT